jgi:hypothetical protein
MQKQDCDVGRCKSESCDLASKYLDLPSVGRNDVMRYRHKKVLAAATLAVSVTAAPFVTATATEKVFMPPNVAAQPAPPSVHLACSYRKIDSGWSTVKYGIYAKNTTGRPIPEKTKIKWKIRLTHGSLSKPVVGSQSTNQIETGEFLITSRRGLQVGEEIKVTEQSEAFTKTETWKIAGCDAEI